ncbi:MAG: gephyrin-like molybdotransferase Glp [Rhodospirillaceae bacterium]
MNKLLPVEEARQRICDALPILGTEQVSLEEGLGRVLAEDAISRRTQPPFPVSAMDGYAVRAQDVVTLPSVLKVIGEVPAGKNFSGSVSSGEAVRIFTGARVPAGADTIVIQENTEQSDKTIRVIGGEAPVGRFIRPSGLDFELGDKLITCPKLLNYRDIGLLASMNLPWLKVRKRPIISLLATGDEIVMPGDPLGENQIVSSNVIALKAFIKQKGGIAIDLGIAEDNKDSLLKLAKNGLASDLLITTGGASVGDHDLVQSGLSDLGLKVDFWRIAMRPGKPLIFGKISDTPLLGLPGNPVSSLVCATIFLGPAIAAMQGLNNNSYPKHQAVLEGQLPSNDEREDYLRGSLKILDSGITAVTPFKKQDSSVFSGMAAANCLIVRKPFAPVSHSGDLVDYILLD